MGKIEYIILCKIPREEDRVKAFEHYVFLKRTATKGRLVAFAKLCAIDECQGLIATFQDGIAYILEVEHGNVSNSWVPILPVTSGGYPSPPFRDACTINFRSAWYMCNTPWMWPLKSPSDVSRAQGWNFCLKLTLPSEPDVAYFETKCAVHEGLKEDVSTTMTDVVSMWFEVATEESSDVAKAQDTAVAQRASESRQKKTQGGGKGFFAKWKEETSAAYEKLGPGGHQRF